MKTIDTIAVCDDCYCAINCGELWDISDYDRGTIYLAINAKLHDKKIVAFPTTDSVRFSWHKCDMCERKLSGNRHDMVLKTH